MDDYRKNYDRLNASEKLTLALMPLSVGKIQDDAEKALAEAKRRFDPSTLHNGRGDAFRHCYWAALMTRDIGFLNTKSITDAHEDGPGNPRAEKDMDLHNNLQGILIGLGHKKSSDKELADLCEAALRVGKLKVLVP